MKNCNSTFNKLLDSLSPALAGEEIIEDLEAHPDYPSLLAISEVLERRDIPNAAYQLKTAELHQVPLPFVAHLSSNEGEFALVEAIQDGYFIVSNERWQHHKLSTELFNSSYLGIVLIIDPETVATLQQKRRQKEMTRQLQRLRVPVLISALLLCGLSLLYLNSSYFHTLNWQIIWLSAVKTAGVLISVALLMQSLDVNNPLLQRFCTMGKNMSCNSILSSKGAKLFNTFSWSEIGLLYFVSTGGVLLFYGYTPLLTVLSLLCLPYTFYSIHYQYKAGTWCVLCCIVQGLLWLELFPSLAAWRLPLQLPDAAGVSAILACFAVPTLLWLLVRPYLQMPQQLRNVRKALKTFKYNADLFQKALKAQTRYDHPDASAAIILGNPNADKVITIVSDPFCQPCSRAHETLEQWAAQRDDLQLRVIFLRKKDGHALQEKVVRHLMLLNAQPDKTLVQQALKDWHHQQQKDYDRWAGSYPVNEQVADETVLATQAAWCKHADIRFTPTILIDGYRLPDPYLLQDVKYFL